MMSEQASYRRILFSTSIAGGATVLTILVGIFRTKIMAVVVGPEGIGLVGLLTNVSGLIAAMAAMGLGLAAVREIAATDLDERKAEVRQTLWLASLPLGLLGAAAMWVLREPIAILVTGTREHSLLFGLSGLAVLFGVLVAAQQGVLQGLSRIKALALIKVLGALAATALAIPAVLYLGEPGLVVALVAVPLATLIVGMFVRHDLPRVPDGSSGRFMSDTRLLLKLGAVMTFTGVLQLLALAAVRSIVVRDAGIEAGGLFHAVIAITSMNITLVLGAMAADYYPRLSAAMAKDAVGAGTIVSHQLHTALLLALPLIAGIFTAAPIVLTLLYTGEFRAAETMLRWQLLGDILKLPGWALGYVLLARGDRSGFLAAEVSHGLTYVGGAGLLVPTLGLTGAGIAYGLAYLVYGGLLFVRCRAKHGLRLQRSALLPLAVLPVLAGLLFLHPTLPLVALTIGAVLTLALGLHAIRDLKIRTGF